MLLKDSNDFYIIRYMRHDKVTGSFYMYTAHFPNGENNIGFYNDFIPFDTEKMSFGIITHSHFDHIALYLF